MMDKYIKQSIEGRKNAIGATYEVSTEMQKKIDALFGEIEEFGAECKDVGDFEAQFAASSLNQKYLDLFTEVAVNSQAKVTVPKVSKNEIGKMMAGDAVFGVAESALGQVMDDIVPTRAAVNQELTDIVRGAPVLGDIMDVSEKAGYAAHLGKLFGKKKKKD